MQKGKLKIQPWVQTTERLGLRITSPNNTYGRCCILSKVCRNVCFCFRRGIPPVGQVFLNHEVSISHTKMHQSVELLWTSDQLVAEISTWQHTALTTDTHQCLQWDSNPQSQEANGRRRTSYTVRSLEMAT